MPSLYRDATRDEPAKALSQARAVHEALAIMIEFIVAVALLGLFVWAVTTLIPMPPTFHKVIYVVAVVFIVLYALSFFGLIDSWDWWHYRGHHGR